MNWLDYSLILIIAVSTTFAAMRGFLREVVSLAAWVVAFTAASQMGRLVEPSILPHVTNPSLAGMIAFALVFIAALSLMWIAGHLLKAMASSAGLSGLDRGLGMLFGMLRGILIILLGYMAFLAMEMQPPQMMRQSLLSPFAVDGAMILGKAMPEGSAMVKRIQGNVRQYESMGSSAAEAARTMERLQGAGKGGQGAATAPSPTAQDLQQLNKLLQQLEPQSGTGGKGAAKEAAPKPGTEDLQQLNKLMQQLDKEYK